MEEYIVSARKYRPLTFDSVVGQRTLTTTLKNAVVSGKLAHAYLFCGPRGVGKTTCARIFAKAINCLTPTADGEACNQCESCQAFNEQRSYNIFELDAASNNSVDNIKSLMEQTRIPPQVGKYKVFIIDEVHMLSTQAFNAFLKTLEEPPAHVIFILATTEKHKILPTIISRCQIYDFDRMSIEDTILHLKEVAQKEGIEVEDEALAVIAEKADGGMRDALSIFDQTASFCQGKITYEKVIEDLNVLDADNYFRIIDLSLENKVSDIMLLLNQIITRGFDGGNLINGLAAHVRNVLMAKDAQTLPLLEVSQQQRERYQQQAQKAPTPFLYKALQLMNQCDQGYRQSSNKRLLVELTLIQVAQITQPDDAESAGRSPKRLKSLFQKLLNSNRQQKVASQGGTAGRQQHKTVSTEPVKTDAPKPKSAVKLDGLGLTFKSLKKQEEVAQTDEPEVENKDEKGLFTQEQLQKEWRAMCDRMPKEMVAMAQRMKNMTPKLLTADSDAPKIEIVVDNNILLDQIKSIQKRVHATLAKSLQNGNIDLQIRLAETGEIKPVLTKRQIFDLIRKENPAIEKLRESFKLQLS
ncbi:MAG: DNA polymerase III subunit gamma/tau [Prevotella sp.]|nr:DNA polymerase III subunit gamma/tau [Prevotella sp.]